jgi:hypothetical protein
MEITKEDFEAYEEVRVGGRTNMLAVSVVSALSGLPREKVMAIIHDYEELMKKYPEVRQ